MINDGIDYLRAEDYHTAIRYLKEAYEASCKISIEYKECRVLMHLADAYMQLKKHRKVIEYSEQSLKISQEQGDAEMEKNLLVICTRLIRLWEKMIRWWSTSQSYLICYRKYL